MKIKPLLIIVVLAIAILSFGGVANAQTTDIQALIAQLRAQIAQLMAQIQVLQAQQGQGQTWCHTFKANVGMGQKTGNSEIDALKTALEKEDLYNSATGISSDDSEGYNEAVASAVTGFQEKYASEILTPYNLKHGTGFMGKATRAKLNALYGCKIEPKACTQDAKQCSDGSYVSRTGPNCEFTKCPNIQCTTDSDCPQLGVACSLTYCPANKCINGKCAIINSAPTCSPNWQTGAWSACANSQQTRTITDLNNCGVAMNKPVVTQSCANTNTNTNTTTNTECATSKNCQDIYKNCYYSCSNDKCVSINTLVALKPYPDCTSVISTSACAPNWTCGAWSPCANSTQTRICADAKNCGVATNKPAESQSCVSSCPTVNCLVDYCPGKHLPDSNGCINCSTPCSTT